MTENAIHFLAKNELGHILAQPKSRLAVPSLALKGLLMLQFFDIFNVIDIMSVKMQKKFK